jgi:type IV pilus assembly protein PilW
MMAIMTYRIPRQHGLTLVELLIALVMGLILLAGMVTVFVANKQTFRFQDALSRLQENGRFAIALLERDIRRVGYTGFENLELLTNTVGYKKVSATCPAPVWLPDLGEPLDGFDNVGGTESAFSSLTPKPKSGTDVIRLFMGEELGIKVQKQPGNVSPGSADLQVTAGAKLKPGSVLLVVDEFGEQGSIFVATDVTALSAKTHTNIKHEASANPNDPVQNCVKSLARNYDGGYIVAMVRSIYYVAETTRKDVTGQPIPALYRSINYDAPEELVEGVEDMQIRYGVDTDGNGAVDGYDNAAEVTSASNWPSVRSVRFQLLLRSVDAKALPQANEVTFDVSVPDEVEAWDEGSPSTEGLWRQTYGTVVALRNRAE